MRPATSDPTAGVRAHQIQTEPRRPQRNLDPTDPRHGELLSDLDRLAVAPPILDPTNPDYGEARR